VRPPSYTQPLRGTSLNRQSFPPRHSDPAVAGEESRSGLTKAQSSVVQKTVEPAALRNPQYAVACAEREVAMSHGREPSKPLTLAQAYRASGQIEKSRTTAEEGLALLPTPQPRSVKPNIRELLEKASSVGLRI